MREYPARETLKAGKPVYGSFLGLASPAAAEVMASAGFDFLVIDAEHSPAGLETQAAMVCAMKATNALPVTRVADNQPAVIKQALDAGPAGIMIPMVASAADAAAAIRACLYPPAGIRGVGGGYASLFGTDPLYYFDANDLLLKIIQIEHADAVEDIEAILAVEGIDVAFIGPTDLSSSMGHMGNPGHPDVQAAIAKVAAAAKRAGVALGIYCFSSEEAQEAAKQGFTFISIGMEAGLLAAAAADALDTIQG